MFFLCANNCVNCDKKSHIERVYKIDRNFRFKFIKTETIINRIQEIISDNIESLFQEFILISTIHKISKINILSHIENVILNYDFENTKIKVRKIQSKKNIYLIKRIRDDDENSMIRLFCHI